ncbi:hypothetical protein FHR83_007643 [Actinoplanes campanulatus]|uniref:Uncharacterized protein n=1 Tax=Actinoplanes campanulatus TaxID=113559 RepID=A0A7W5FIU8_9ACTN|nr:hypothetical protein [Actinoplanes campanulatus]MBB3099927.1 hypothetical protein [Actinoplanes campanulatus]GGN48242.1 hypothetical protein GCM10010109_85220 [Actinoplanes campanulatus]GID40489.1 hypothetical protein Aca09nite_69950 [Actinoplanes campanulatus]
MDSRRRLRAGGTLSFVPTHGGYEDQFSVGVHLFDLDADQMRKKLLDGITQPDNDSSFKISHGVRARARY